MDKYADERIKFRFAVYVLPQRLVTEMHVLITFPNRLASCNTAWTEIVLGLSEKKTIVGLLV